MMDIISALSNYEFIDTIKKQTKPNEVDLASLIQNRKQKESEEIL